MRIDFFEEFPEHYALKKLELIDFGITVYVATKSLGRFLWLKHKVKQYSAKADAGWWPVLERREGYWMSPFSSRAALKRIIDGISHYRKNIKVMWDAELPSLRPALFLNPQFFINRSLIRGFFRKSRDSNVDILAAEYPAGNLFLELIYRFFGISFNPREYGSKKIVMHYTSMHKQGSGINALRRMHEKYGSSLAVGLGTIAPGVKGTEPLLSPAGLDRDLRKMKRIGIEHVVIFRLGGMDEEYAKVIGKYV